MDIIEDSTMIQGCYNGFIIKDSMRQVKHDPTHNNIKKSIDDLYKQININFNVFINCDTTKFTIKENITILEYLLGNKKNIKLYVNDIIYIFEQILRIYLENCAQEKRPQFKAFINGELCEFIIKYNFLFEHSLYNNKLDSIKNYFISRCMQLSIKQGCILSWLTFATLCPHMIHNNCYLQINTKGIIYKYINWKYIKEKSLLRNKLDLYFKYYPESTMRQDTQTCSISLLNIEPNSIDVYNDMKISYI